MNRHIIVAKTADNDAWFTSLDGLILSAGTASAEGAVKAAIKMLKDDGGADFSFSTRTADQLLEHPLVEDPEQLLISAPGASIMVLAPEGRPIHDDHTLWATCWRTPMGGLSSTGIKSRFRQQTLVERVMEFFERERWQSFRPETPSEMHSIQRIDRPYFAREVLVRHDWRIRDIVPDAFAPPGAAFAAAR